MSFQPTIPTTGLAGWRFLQRTEVSQKATFDKNVTLAKDIQYFTDNIAKVSSAADLVADRRLLKVALGAFGLDSEISKKAFIRKVLDEGSTESTALAVRMTEPSYKKLAAAFGFGDAGGSRTAVAGFAKTITDAYKTRAFEAAVGDSNENMRLALNFKREIADLASSEKPSWYSIIGSKSMRKVIEKAFGLPSDSFGKLDVDRQRCSARPSSPSSRTRPTSPRSSTAFSPAPRSRKGRPARILPPRRSRCCAAGAERAVFSIFSCRETDRQAFASNAPSRSKLSATPSGAGVVKKASSSGQSLIASSMAGSLPGA